MIPITHSPVDDAILVQVAQAIHYLPRVSANDAFPEPTEALQQMRDGATCCYVVTINK